MFNKIFLTFFLLFSSLITIYPSKKENTNLFNYCYSFEKILSRNLLEKNKFLSDKFKLFGKDFSLFGTKKTQGALANKLIDQYKASNKSLIINIFPNQIFCLAGYWIEHVNPGTFNSILYEKSKQKINEYNVIRKEVDEFLKNINLEYEDIKKEIKDFF